MKPSEQCKKAGLSSLKKMSKMTGKSEQTLINWFKNDRLTFDILLLGCQLRKLIDNKKDEII